VSFIGHTPVNRAVRYYSMTERATYYAPTLATEPIRHEGSCLLFRVRRHAMDRVSPEFWPSNAVRPLLWPKLLY